MAGHEASSSASSSDSYSFLLCLCSFKKSQSKHMKMWRTRSWPLVSFPLAAAGQRLPHPPPTPHTQPPPLCLLPPLLPCRWPVLPACSDRMRWEQTQGDCASLKTEERRELLRCEQRNRLPAACLPRESCESRNSCSLAVAGHRVRSCFHPQLSI